MAAYQGQNVDGLATQQYAKDAPQYTGGNTGTSSVEQVLEVIADAVLQICLFQVEAKENDSHLTNPDVGPLVAAITLLSKLAKSKAAQWTETEEADNRSKMVEAITVLDRELLDISKMVDILQVDLYDKEAKKKLLWACRNAMQQTVALLQISDRYDIRKIIRGAKLCHVENDRMATLTEVPVLTDAVRAYVFATVQLAKLILARIKYIVDPVLKRRLEQGNQVIQQLPEQLVGATVATFENTDPAYQTRRIQIHDQVKAAIEDLVAATKQSSQELFAGIDLELQPLDDDEEGIIRDEDVAMKAQNILDRLARAVDRTADAANKGNGNEAGLGARAVRDLVGELEEMSKDRPDLDGAMDRLKNALKGLLGAVKDSINDPNNPANRAKLTNAADDLKRGARDLVDEFLKDPSVAALQAQNMNALLALADLENAVAQNNKDEATRALKGALEALKGAAEEANGQELTPDGRAALDDAMNRLNDILRKLLEATKKRLDNPNDPAANDAFLKALEDARNLAIQIQNAVDPQSGNVVGPGASQSVNMSEAMERLKDALRRLRDAAKKGDQPNATIAVKDINDAVGKQVALARAAAARTKDPKKKNQLLDIAAKLAEAMKELLTATKDAVLRPNDPVAQERLRKATEAVNKLGRQLNDQLLSPVDQVLEGHRNIGNLSDDLDKHVRAKDKPNASGTLENLNDVIQQQKDWAKEHAKASPEAAAQINPALASMQNAYDTLARAGPALCDKADTATQQQFDNARKQLKDASEAVATAVAAQAPPEAAAENAAEISVLGERLENAVKNHKEKDAVALAAVVQAKINKQALLARAAAAKSSDARLKANLIKASQDLSDSIRDMMGATKDALIDLHKIDRLQRLLAAVNDANSAIMGATDPFETYQNLRWAMDDVIGGLKFGALDQNSQPELSAVVSSLEAQVLLAKKFTATVEDPKLKADIQKKIRELEKLIPKVVAAIEKVLKNPNDAFAQKQLEEILVDASAASRSLAETMEAAQSLDKRIKNNSSALEKELERLEREVRKGNQEGAKDSLNKVQKRMETAQQLATLSTAACVDDKLNVQIDQLVKEAKSVSNSLPPVTNSAVASPNNAGLVQNFSKVVQQARDLNKKLAETSEKALKAVEPSIDNGGNKDQMRAAARQVQAATRALQVDDTPKGRLNATLKRIAEEMKKLTDAAIAGDKKGMILAAQNIAKLVANIITDSQALGAECSDRRLVDVLLGQAFAAKNHSVVLKILAAVKTSTDAADPTAEAQLAQCAKNLATSVLGAVVASDACALKAIKPAGGRRP